MAAVACSTAETIFSMNGLCRSCKSAKRSRRRSVRRRSGQKTRQRLRHQLLLPPRLSRLSQASPVMRQPKPRSAPRKSNPGLQVTCLCPSHQCRVCILQVMQHPVILLLFHSLSDNQEVSCCTYYQQISIYCICNLLSFHHALQQPFCTAYLCASLTTSFPLILQHTPTPSSHSHPNTLQPHWHSPKNMLLYLTTTLCTLNVKNIATRCRFGYLWSISCGKGGVSVCTGHVVSDAVPAFQLR